MPVRAPIFDFNEARSSVVSDVVRRVTSQIKNPELVLNEAAFLETRRLQHSGGSELSEWRAVASSLGRMSDAERKDKLRHYAERYAWDIAGNFNPRVFKFATKALGPLLGAFMSPRQMLKNLPGSLDLAALDSRIVIEGMHKTVAKLSELGTVVYVPTHLSNLDSIVFGFALERAGLAPATYGAGKNLFTNPVLSFFMHNLGAYRVDRRLRHSLYKDVLKAYSCVLIERGYDSLFFPGGTRSRSGGVERRLKLGLAGTGVEAYARTTENGKPQRVFFVPATINYLLTLEAETLIDDFLQEEGKARYIIEDDESSRLARVLSFLNKFKGLDAACVIRFSQPLDCFGNRVDDDGQSYDAQGRTVDTASYIEGPDGRPCFDPARDAEYTRQLGETIVQYYQKDTVLMATQVVAAAAFKRLEQGVGAGDLFALLRHRDDIKVRRDDLSADIDVLVAKARALEDAGKVRVAPFLRSNSGGAILASALRAFAGYHTHPVLEPQGDELVLSDTRLLFYYQNRLATLDGGALAVDHMAPKWAKASPRLVS